MKPTLSRLAALTATCTTLCACNISKQRIDYSWFADTMMSAQDDEVMVEVGQGLNSEASPTPDKPATPAPAIAATPAPLPPVTAPVAAPPAPEPAPAPLVAQNQPTQQTAPTPTATQQQPAPSQQTAPAPERKSWFASLFGQKQTTEQVAATPKTYTVKAGDTLSVIARRHRVGMMALAKANNLANPNALRIGQVLVIPGTGTTPRPAARAAAPAPAPAVSAPVPTATAPVAATPAPVSSPAISAPAPAPAATATHTVSAGETLTSIARRYNTTIAKIMQANNMTPEQAHRLSIGQRILVPRP